MKLARRLAPSTLAAILAPLALLSAALPAHAHSVAQVQTAKRIAASTIVLLDPQGNPKGGGSGTDTTANIGDVLTFVIQFTPVPNNATRGAGGYITEYVPANTEVVGARIIDADGNTVAPKRGPQMDDGWGPRGRHGEFDALGLLQGSLSQVYADTGIFFSTDPRTARAPADAFITVLNGLSVTPVPTGAGQLDNFLGFAGPPYHAHDEWDRVQAIAFGGNGGSVVSNGQGNTPFGFGSAVAGPDTHYRFEKVLAPRCSNGGDDDSDGLDDYPDDPQCASALDDDETAATDAPVGPWQRVRYAGSEIGTGVATNCQSCSGGYVRVGVPTDAGWDLSADDPLPAGTNALRFAVGELIVGQEYFAEVSLRVTGLPLDPVMNADVNCSEVFGGDAAMPQNGQDNTWRYFVPSPACVQLNNVFELTVDKLLAVPGDTLVYTIHGKNLSVNPQTNVLVTDTFVAGDVSYVDTIQGPVPTVGAGTLTWPVMTLQPGDEYTFQWRMDVDGGGASTLNRATYSSDALPLPGFSVVALTDIEEIVVIDHAAAASTDPVTTPPSATAGANVHYRADVTNVGTGDATLNGASFIEVTLPAGFSFCAACAAPMINGVPVADPTAGPGNTLVFTAGLATVPANGGALALDFDVTVGGGVAPGRYTIDLQTQFRDGGVGRDVENATFALAPLLVDIAQSEPPVLASPVLAGATTVSGTSSEGAGATIVVFVNGNSVAPVVAGAGGTFVAAVPTLFGGQHLNATAQSGGEVVSDRSSPDVVVLGTGGTTFCNDGLDNDGDGLTDFPDDPGCTSAVDPDETDVPACSDGLDNDGDGDIDFPDDASCSSFADDDESGPPACSDGVDNDDDGDVDFPDDAGCSSADDPSEADVPACSDGVDNDDDGAIDYPSDLGCDSPFDDDEVEGSTGDGGGGGGSPTTSGAGGEGPASNGAGNGTPPDLGGVPAGDFASGSGSGGGDGAEGGDSGCGCRTAAEPRSRGALAWVLAAVAVATLRRRRRVVVAGAPRTSPGG